MPAHTFLFFSPTFEPGVPFVDLTEGDHHHLARVLRLKNGDSVRVTNGRGAMAAGVVADVGRECTRVRLTNPIPTHERDGRLVLALALVARERFEQAFEQCIELGITECIPVVTERCRLRSVSRAMRSRLEKIAVSAMKQSGQATIVTLAEAAPLDAVLDRAIEFERTLVGAQGASGGYGPGRGDTLVLVGPEADFSDDEIAAIRAAGATERGLSPYRLRSSTAAAALVASVTMPVD